MSKDDLKFHSSENIWCVNIVDFLPPLWTRVEYVLHIACVLSSPYHSVLTGEQQTDFTVEYCHLLHQSM